MCHYNLDSEERAPRVSLNQKLAAAFPSLPDEKLATRARLYLLESFAPGTCTSPDAERKVDSLAKPCH